VLVGWIVVAEWVGSRREAQPDANERDAGWCRAAGMADARLSPRGAFRPLEQRRLIA
jgi:hypothetical protein